MQKVALVTGASRGIGAATAKLLAQRGYRVAINYRQSGDEAEHVVKAIASAGGQAHLFKTDMADLKAIPALFTAVRQTLGPVAALVNNAAINPSGALDAFSDEQLVQLFHTNVLGVFASCREAVAQMKQAGGGAIVNVSSEAARFGSQSMAYYAASKGAINSYTIGAARECAAFNIRMNAVSPGIIDTDAHRNDSPERKASLSASLPMKRMGTADEVAQTIAWLLSDEASYVSGSIVSVAGAR